MSYEVRVHDMDTRLCGCSAWRLSSRRVSTLGQFRFAHASLKRVLSPYPITQRPLVNLSMRSCLARFS